ncbi:G-type lectin S-receptor-like serine/threonine-protein kinase At1g11330 isoform X1 [Aristolochia californica]|uniref:G-type lectin S-receptor-like serine/threonine-protein kinase At1g11330 isoform X1 n=1 Tax=Aristolochia californica TaxID=171875 RepID=UPI0035E321AB
MWRWLGKRREPGQYDEDVKRLIPVGTELSYQSSATSSDSLNHEEGRELPIFDFKVVVFATDNFSLANKLGGGGFGPVYKGILPGGQEVAVKRLSKSSGQGLQEFRNEVLVISRVQHKNLVRLFGYCIEGEEKMLLYEYMPNKSLDSFIFDSDEQKLDWAQRFHIIEGIARGLLYLHRDSRLKIIHRDLKASNILLDRELNPKISDFGLARIFGGNQIQAETRRVVGTYGYMSPEYAMEGRFSEKSDVFSFGVLLLEIVSGKKNTGFFNQESSLNLLSHAWKLWNDGQALTLIDPKLGSTYSVAEVLRCIHVGLLCVQEYAADRPTISAITLFLGTDTATPPTPKQPAFTVTISRGSTSTEERASVNNVTITMLEGR